MKNQILLIVSLLITSCTSEDINQKEEVILPFSLITVDISASISLEVATDINIEITENSPIRDIYRVNYSNDNTGILIFENKEIEPGQGFNIPVGKSTGTYAGLSTGIHYLTFELPSKTGNTVVKKVLVQ